MIYYDLTKNLDIFLLQIIQILQQTSYDVNKMSIVKKAVDYCSVCDSPGWQKLQSVLYLIIRVTFKNIMKIYILILSTCLASIIPVSAANNNLNRWKRQEPPWVWGSSNEETSASIVLERRANEQVDDNPCTRKINSVPPDFRKLGLARISQIKCAEYIWQMKYREDLVEVQRECNRKLGIYFIIGGHITEPGEFPHMAAIGWRASVGTWSFKCGGSLISNNFVLTAAHCTKLSDRDSSVADPYPKIVRLGDKNIADVLSRNLAPVDVNISRIIQHPLYQSPKTYNDVALLQLAQPVVFSKYIQPACLWNKFDTRLLSAEAIITGWGVVDTASLQTSPELQKATVDILNSNQCNELLRLCNRKWCGMQDNQMCAGKLGGGVDSCQGDSGGPLQVKIPLPITTQGTLNYVIGVTSFGSGCALPNTPGVYSRVSHFIAWIESVVWP